MKVNIKFNNDDKHNINKKWIRVTLLILGLLFSIVALTQIFCIVFKPDGYQRIVDMLGNQYIKQLLFGILFIGTYYVIKNSNPVKPNWDTSEIGLKLTGSSIVSKLHPHSFKGWKVTYG